MNPTVRLAPLPTIKELLKLYNVNALRRLSQNFLLDLRLTDKIVRAAGRISNGEVCEVGPGPGGITRSILSHSPSKLILIEKDLRFKPILDNLAEACFSTECNTIYGDILSFDMSEMFSKSYKTEWDDEPPNIHLIGNLPFNVSTPLIIKWMKDIFCRRSAWTYGRVKMTLTFQEEVAERIIAPPGSYQRCRMSVICQNYCHVEHKFTIPGRAFLPKPDVNVGIVHLVPHKNPLIPLDFACLEKVTRSLFNTKRKYLKTCVRNLFPKQLWESLTVELLERAELKPAIRAFQLTNEEWANLCAAYKLICDRDPRLYRYNYRGERATREYDWMTEEEKETHNEEEEEEEEEDGQSYHTGNSTVNEKPELSVS